MLRHLNLACFAIGIAWAMPVLAQDPPVPLRQGERIIFFGDSITSYGASRGGYVSLVRDALTAKHKKLGIEVIGAGVGGNRVPDLQARVDRDVIAKKPTLVFIYIGINVVWHFDSGKDKGTPPQKYVAGLREVARKITDSGARVVLCTPSVIGERSGNGNKHDSKLDEYAALSRKVAKDLNLPVCDLRKAFYAYLKENNPTNKEKGVLTVDRVHLNAEGNRLVAEQVLKMFGD